MLQNQIHAKGSQLRFSNTCSRNQS